MYRLLLKNLRVALCLATAVPCAVHGQDAPWRIDSALDTPEWLTIGGSVRLRYEFLDNTFRIVGPSPDDYLVSRSRLHIRARGERYYAGFELQDSRGWLESALTPVGTDDVNVLEPLEAYVGYRNGGLDVQLGRVTMDIGSRRLISRNRFRNTTNIFTGVNVLWSATDGPGIQAFLTMPAARLPNNLDPVALRDNDQELDQERRDQVFWGVYVTKLGLPASFEAEAYLYGLDEDDRPSVPTRNRDILTAGFRLQRSSDGRDFEFETAYQYGESRASFQPSDMTDLDNRAWFVHTELEQALLGRFDASLIFRFDYATGDSNPSDGEFNTFDSLFGDRSWEFGPTGIYGALHRMNLVSPGIALRMNPMQDVDVRLDYRAAWLESDRDYLITAAVRDPDGNSGSFVGHQLDGRWNWQAVPGNLAIAVGVAYLWKGEFLKTAPTAPPSDDTAYAYVATTLTF